MKQPCRRQLQATEHFWLESPFGHQVYVHTRRYGLLCGSGFCTIAWGLLSLSAGDLATAVTLGAAMLVISVIMLVMIACPCPCGEPARLTPEGRRQLRTSPPAKTIATSVIGAAAAMAAISAGGNVLGGHACAIITGWSLMLLGIACTVATLCGTVEQMLGVRRIDPHLLPGHRPCSDELEEMDRMITYFLQAGEFEEADALSRRLLLKVEKEAA